MKNTFIALLFTVFGLAGCASIFKKSGVEVAVKSVGFEIDASKNIGFMAIQEDNESLPAYVKRKKIIDTCYEASKSTDAKLIPLTPKDRRNDIEYVASYSLEISEHQSVSKRPTYTTPVTTNCYGYGNSANCTTSGGQTYGGGLRVKDYYVKVLQIEFYKMEDLVKDVKTAKPIRNIRAAISSENSDVNEKTANSLCRAAFVNFPNDGNGEVVIQNPESPTLVRQPSSD